MPVSLLEGFAAGLPIVTTAAGGIPAFVHDRVNGHVVPVDDDEALAARVLELVRDPAEVERLSRAGAEAASQLHLALGLAPVVRALCAGGGAVGERVVNADGARAPGAAGGARTGGRMARSGSSEALRAAQSRRRLARRLGAAPRRGAAFARNRVRCRAHAVVEPSHGALVRGRRALAWAPRGGGRRGVGRAAPARQGAPGLRRRLPALLPGQRADRRARHLGSRPDPRA